MTDWYVRGERPMDAWPGLQRDTCMKELYDTS